MHQESVAALFVTCSDKGAHTYWAEQAPSTGRQQRALSVSLLKFISRLQWHMSVCMSRRAVSGAWGTTIVWCRLLLCVASPVLPAATPVLSSAWLIYAGLRIVRSILVPRLPVPNGTMVFFGAHWCNKADFSQ